MRTLLLFALGLFLLPAANAQAEKPGTPPVQKMGNFEIQDLMVSIRYDEARRGRTQATVTAKSPAGKLDMEGLMLVASSNGRMARIPLRAADDGTLTGTGTLPTLGETDELAILMGRDTGFRFGVPTYDPTREGWNIEQGSAWNIEQGSAITSQRGNGWRVDITIETDPPVIVIVVEG